MEWQLLVVYLVVAVAGLYLVRATWRSLSSRKAGCGTSCDCGQAKNGLARQQNTLIPVDELRVRIRTREPRP